MLESPKNTFFYISEGRKLFGGYRITPKNCRATKTLPSSDPRASGPTICMFNHECAQRNGEVVGACMDGFLFGACCQIPATDELQSTLINDAQNVYYQQQQQQKLQIQQSYENYGQNSQQLQSQENQSNQNGYYQESSSTYDRPTSQQSEETSAMMSTTTSQENSSHKQESTELSQQVVETSQASGSLELENESNIQSNVAFENSNSISENSPPSIHVHKNSVKISSPSAPPHNDDFVMQVLSTLPPEHDNSLVTFTTEVPMKIASSLVDHSSESNSFEEEPTPVTQSSLKTEKPLKTVDNTPKPALEKPQKTTPAVNHKHNQNMFDIVTEFNHSDITHPGADADLLENDLQFSTGYGPQPAYVPHPDNKKTSQTSSTVGLLTASTTDKNAETDENYVLVHTITTDQANKAGNPTTSSSITTHVDSIESIILQLNNTHRGPTYNVVNNEQTPSYGYVTDSDGSDYDQTSAQTNSEQQTATIPAYLETVSTNINTSSQGSSTSSYGDNSAASSASLEDHTVPEKNYNDVSSGYATSEFNKMPVIGVAYPVDMAYDEVVDHQKVSTTKAPVTNNYEQSYPTTHRRPGPIATYIGVVTAQDYTSQPIVSSYNQVPNEVSVISQTTQVQGDYNTEKKPAADVYVIKTPNTTPLSYISSTSTPLELRPQYTVSSTAKPAQSTAKPKPTKRPTKITSSNKRPTTESNKKTTKPKLPNIESSYNQNKYTASSPSRVPTKKPISTSYVTGPSTPRPPSTLLYHDDAVPPLIVADDKLDSFVQSTAAQALGSSSYNQVPVYANAVSALHIQQQPLNTHKKPGFVKVQPTIRPPSPTVLITPKPTVNSDLSYSPTTPAGYGSTSYVYSPLVTRRPTVQSNIAPQYVKVPQVISNDFDDPGYYGVQNNQQQHYAPALSQSPSYETFAAPLDDKPAFPGYYGPTPTYPAFQLPEEKPSAPTEEETYTSPNDFVNFPPVRNPNLNMSAVSSAVTSDIELSTPAFVEDAVLKNKMNTLVHKIVESLQGNFDALSDLIDENNSTATTYQSDQISGANTVNRKTTKKPNRTTITTKKPVTRVSTKPPTKKTTTTKRPVTRRTTTTRKPATRRTTRKPITTTTAAAQEDEIVDEEDEEDTNPINNEVDQDPTLSNAAAGGRKIRKYHFLGRGMQNNSITKKR